MNAQPDFGMTVTTFENPMGINGFEFVEFAAPAGQGQVMRKYLENLGFTAVARHKDRDITLFRQGTINFLLNESADSFASDFARKHGLTTAQAMDLIRRIGNDRAKLNEAAVRLRRGLPSKPG